MRFFIFSLNKDFRKIFNNFWEIGTILCDEPSYVQIFVVITEKCASKWQRSQKFFNNSKAHRIAETSRNMHQKDVHFVQEFFSIFYDCCLYFSPDIFIFISLVLSKLCAYLYLLTFKIAPICAKTHIKMIGNSVFKNPTTQSSQLLLFLGCLRY